ncbi:type II-A CRISPR-associated protein Csn2 [Weissella halotolerans]|uniref:Uncharacterized protein n=1 Tax=Weissella halotolerans DSM 20190 TaxID=1123500 RepID=A0A0R2FVQ4_9LACO|nr:type II-A CRISPR-associated protein Csn2 [Weissella halotolerans]KRN32402.1 hypothetical protein IV68_GL000753 [Weissella halotolerans DSM 20190]
MTERKITIEGIATFTLTAGLNVIALQNASLFFRTVTGIQANYPEIVYSEDLKVVSFSNGSIFIGDALGSFNVADFYARQVMKAFQAALTEEDLAIFYQLNQQLQTKIEEVIIDANLPFSLVNTWDLNQFLKGQVMAIETVQVTSIFDKIVSIIEVMALMSESRLLIMTNLHLYCTFSELQQLHQILLAEDLVLLDLDLVEDKPHANDTFTAYFIDNDYVVFS